jgi:hypothetical protein
VAATTRRLLVRSGLPAIPAYDICLGLCFCIRPTLRGAEAGNDSIGGTDVALVALREDEDGRGVDNLTRLRPRCADVGSGDSEARDTADVDEAAGDTTIGAGDDAADDGISKSSSFSSSGASVTSRLLDFRTAISGLEIGVVDLDAASDRRDETGVGSWSVAGAGEACSTASLFAWIGEDASRAREGLFFRFFDGFPCLPDFLPRLILSVRFLDCFICSVSF